MRGTRLFATLVFFVAAMSMNSFGYSVLCQSLPVSISVNNFLKPLFTCSIPANAVPTGKSLRVTVNLHPVNSGPLDSFLYFNGGQVISNGNASPQQNNEQNWSFVVTNTGGTGFSIGGTTSAPGSIYVLGPQNGSRPSVPWSSGWTLEIQVAFRTGTSFVCDGDTFVVEILD